MEIIYYILSGAVVGLIVGVTGVGGGALMTPLLLLFGFPPHIAIGTDLWYAAITKSGGLWAHQRKQHIRWDLVMALAVGSLPASALTGLALYLFFETPEHYTGLLQTALGVMLIVTALVLMFRRKLMESISAQANLKTLSFWGAVLGVFVTLTSVGAGAIGTAILMIFFPLLLPKQVVGTDIAHAVPLTFIAGLVHFFLGNVDFALLLALITGSLPAIYLGTQIATKLPSRVLQPLLALALLVLGLKYAIF